MIINFSECITDVHYFGDCMVVTIDNQEYILNAAKSFICKRVLQQTDSANLIQEIIDDNNLSEDERYEVKKNIEAFMLESDLGKRLFKFGDTSRNKNHLKSTGIPNQYYPLKVDIELTNRCNLYCLHCYKRANEGELNSINKEKIFDFLEQNRGLISTVHLTGGEPLLVPYLEELIQRFSNSYHFDLSSNGLLLYQLSDETISKLRNISLTLYGLNDEDYAYFTGNNYGYSLLSRSTNVLKKLNKSYKMNVVLNRDVLNRMEEYVEHAINMGADIFHIGKTSAIGRLSEQESNMDWKLTEAELNHAYKVIRKLEPKYLNFIKILQWEREIYYAASSYTNEMESIYSGGCLACGAGNRTWGLSENFVFTPCIMYKNLLSIDHSKWQNYITGEYQIDWNSIVSDFTQSCEKTNSDICRRLLIFNRQSV